MDDTPVVPSKKIFRRYTMFYCGSCGNRVSLRKKTCMSCGRRIDWLGAYQTEKGGRTS